MSLKLIKVIMATGVAGLNAGYAAIKYKIDSWTAEGQDYLALHQDAVVAAGLTVNEIQHNDAGDAFRHAYAAARLTQLIGPIRAEILGDANEWRNKNNPALEKNMDLWNNAKGREVARLVGSEAPPEVVLAGVLSKLLSGELITSLEDSATRTTTETTLFIEELNGQYPMLRNLAVKGFLDQRPPFKIMASAFILGEVAPAFWGYDPLTADLNNDGHMSAPRAAGAYFDMAHDGFAESSGWVQAGDALVVRDLNHNGSIDSGAELFGDQTRLATGALAANGYTALADLDSNHDGVFSAQDAAWGEVMLWKDNGDGVTQPGELVALTVEGLAALKLSYSTVNALDAAGNILAQTNSTGAALEDGTSVATGTFLLASDPTDTVPLEYLPLNDSIAALPELAGSGLTYDLSQAMARDSVLQAMVASVASSTDYAALPAQFEHLLLRWTHADAVPLGSRGLTMNARHLAVLESFYGQGFINTTDGNANVYPRNPSPAATAILEPAYQQLKGQLLGQFVAQAQLKPYWEAVTVAIDATGNLAVDYQAVAGLFNASADPAKQLNDLWLFGRAVHLLQLDGTQAVNIL